MKLRSIIALALALACSPALAQQTNGTSPLTGAKGGTNNAFMQFAGPASSLKTYTLANASGTIAMLNQVQTWTGVQSFADGTLSLLGSGSGSSIVKAPATGGGTVTLFVGTDTVVGRNTTDTLANKTLTAPIMTTPQLGVATGTSLALTSPSATALVVGANGPINPVLQVDDSTGSQATGVAIRGSTTGGTTSIDTIDSGSNANLQINAKGTGQILIGNNSTGTVSIPRLCPPNRQVFTTGTNATYTTPTCAGNLPTRIEWEMVGGGGGGAGSGTTPGAATAGGNTCVNTSSPACTTPLFAANGGALGSASVSAAAGGTTAGCDLGLVGGAGQNGTSLTSQWGGAGGVSFFGGNGFGGAPGSTAGAAAQGNTGSGGGGGGDAATANSGGGGGAGGFCRKLVTSPASSYFYTVGAAGSAGGAGTGGVSGGAGSAGNIVATAYWQ